MKRGLHSGFTLVELITVVAIIGLLASIILPVVTTAREKARQTDCSNNLRQISLSLTMYKGDNEDQLPGWLSNLYPDYVAGLKSFVCKTDDSAGAEGGKPDEMASSQFTETDDNSSHGASHYERNTDVKARSYLYEFCAAKCSWEWEDYLNAVVADVNLDDITDEASWGEVKVYQLKHGDGSNDHQPYTSSAFPMVRCFHHYRHRKIKVKDTEINEIIKSGVTLNVAYDGNVFPAGEEWEFPVIGQ